MDNPPISIDDFSRLIEERTQKHKEERTQKHKEAKPIAKPIEKVELHNVTPPTPILKQQPETKEIINDKPIIPKENKASISEDYELEEWGLEFDEIEKAEERILKVKKVNTRHSWITQKKIANKYNLFHKDVIFPISKEMKLTGKITSELWAGKSNITVVTEVEERQPEKGIPPQIKLILFGEYLNRRLWKVIKQHSIDFYSYLMKHQETEYILLSERKLQTYEYDLTGSLVSINEEAKISEGARLLKQRPLIFVNTAESNKIKFEDHKEFFNSVKKYNLNEDKFFNYLFSHQDGNSYRHPADFERLIASELIHASYEGKPCDLSILSIAGCGKTSMLDALNIKLEESQPIVEGGNSTLKAIVPSFKSTIPSPGALLTSSRFCFVDEFFRILLSVPMDDRKHALGKANAILDRTKRTYGSGNGSTTATMTARLICGSNLVFGNNLQQLVNKMDLAFMSRQLFWCLDQEHIETIKTRKSIEKTNFKIDNKDFNAWVDYLQTFKSEFENDKVVTILNNGKKHLEDFYELHQIYTARYLHHAQCLLDGIVKLRCIFEFDEKFKATEKDYKMFAEMWDKMLKNWLVSNVENRGF